MKKPSWLLLLWLLAPLLIGWALRDIRFGDIWQALQHLTGPQILALMALNGLVILLMAGRWWLILRAQGHRVNYFSVAGYRLVAFGISYFTLGPQIGGEPAQVYYLQSRHGIPLSRALAAVSLDKILELLASFAFLLVGLSAALVTGLVAELAPFQMMAWIAGPFALLLAYTIAVWSGKTPLAALFNRSRLRHEGLARLAGAAVLAERQISQFCQQKPLVVVGASLFSLVTGCAMLLEYWVTLRFLGIQVSLFQAIAVLTAALIAFLFPLPGGLGALEASQVLAMTALGFNPALGLGASLLIRARDISLGGLGLLWAAWLARRAATTVASTQIVE